MTDLHVFIDDKSVVRSCRTLRSMLNVGNNPIVIIGHKYGYDYSAFENLRHLEDDGPGRRELFRRMKEADRVHLHGFFHIPSMIFLARHPDVAAKCNWIMWGQDLYNLTTPAKSLKSRLIRYFRTRAVRNFGFISTNVPGDYDLLVKAMGKEYTFFKLRFAPEAIADVYKIPSERTGGTVNILLGNSATVTNCHREAIDLLARFADRDILVHTPLSYGNDAYRDEIIAYGREKLGEKFVPMTEFVPHEEYYRFLSSIDVAVFAHDRQQAIGNIVPLLYAGKKVYIRSDISTWECLAGEYGVQLSDYLKLSGESFEDFTRNTVDLALQRSRIDDMTDGEKFVEAYRKMLAGGE